MQHFAHPALWMSDVLGIVILNGGFVLDMVWRQQKGLVLLRTGESGPRTTAGARSRSTSAARRGILRRTRQLSRSSALPLHMLQLRVGWGGRDSERVCSRSRERCGGISATVWLRYSHTSPQERSVRWILRSIIFSIMITGVPRNPSPRRAT